MPRSFLVKTHSGHRVPNYGQLERQRGRGCGLPCPAQGSTPAGQEGREPREREHLSQVGGGARDHEAGGRQVARGRLIRFRDPSLASGRLGGDFLST